VCITNQEHNNHTSRIIFKQQATYDLTSGPSLELKQQKLTFITYSQTSVNLLQRMFNKKNEILL
jgi:hypothetical protein